MDLFDEESQIQGLQYIPNFISEDEETKLVQTINQQEWLTDLKRRVQHYGWKYDYTARRVTEDLRIGELPNWLMKYSEKLQEIFGQTPDQIIINEYEPGQGISTHVDCVPCFGEVIASLSLGSACVMDFTNDKQKESLWLEPRSLIVLKDDARYEWKHSIPARKSDKQQSVKIPRGRRLSLTFRTVII